MNHLIQIEYFIQFKKTVTDYFFAQAILAKSNHTMETANMQEVTCINYIAALMIFCLNFLYSVNKKLFNSGKIDSFSMRLG